MVKKKYRALRFVAFLLQVFGWLSLVLGIIATVGAFLTGVLNWVSLPVLEGVLGSMSGIITGIIGAGVTLVSSIITCVVFLAAADYFFLQIEIEQNTRASAEYLRQLAQAQIITPPPQLPVPAESYPIAATGSTGSTAPTITVESTPTPQ
jgi:hypothetical protein